MPQDTLFGDEQHWTGLRLEVEEDLRPDGRYWRLTVRRADEKGLWRYVWVSRWEGVMLDCASTWAQDCMNAFLFGELRDLARAAQGVERVARAHFKAHESVY